MWEAGLYTFGVVEILPATQFGAVVFNYFFTLMWIFGMMATMITILVKILTRS